MRYLEEAAIAVVPVQGEDYRRKGRGNGEEPVRGNGRRGKRAAPHRATHYAAEKIPTWLKGPSIKEDAK